MKKTILIFAVFINVSVIILSSLCSCGSRTEEAYTEDEYIKMIESLDETGAPMYVTLNNIEEIITKTKSNLIVKCKVVSRDEPMVFDPFGSFTTDTLLSESSPENEKFAAANYISTPYQIEISDVYLSPDSIETSLIGSSIPFYAPYGVIGQYSNRLAGHHILRVGAEYIMFLRVDNIGGNMVYYLAHPIYSLVEIDPQNGKSISQNNVSYSSYEQIYGEYSDELELTEAIESLVADGGYDTSIDTVQ